MNPSDLPYFIAFSVFPGIGPMRFRLLYDYFGSAKSAWEAPLVELKNINLGDALISKFDHFRQTFDIGSYISDLARQRVNTLTYLDPKYPKLLSQISDAPFLLYIKGLGNTAPIDMTRTIAIVGTRKATPYGIDITTRITTQLVDAGFTIISGMAFGIDAVAHQTAISLGGKTIAVLGCGIDIIAPPSNAFIYTKLTCEGYGAVVSEMPLGLRPEKGLFPARNRIISGLSLGVVVTEGADDSGALITARYAAEQGRDVFAIPGPITSPYSKGPNRLIKQGAVVVDSAEDIIASLGVAKKSAVRQTDTKNGKTFSPEEQCILALLSDGPVHIDRLGTMSGLTMTKLSSILTIMELEKVVKDRGEKVYELIEW